MVLCDGVSQRLHRFGMPVLSLCISQPVQCVSTVRFAVQNSVSNQPEGNLSFTTPQLAARLYVPSRRIFWGCMLKKKKAWIGGLLKATMCRNRMFLGIAPPLWYYQKKKTQKKTLQVPIFYVFHIQASVTLTHREEQWEKMQQVLQVHRDKC